METIRTALDNYHYDVLKQLAENINLNNGDQTKRKAWFVNNLSQALIKRAGDRAFIQSLPEAEQAILALLLEANGKAWVYELNIPMMNAGFTPPFWEEDGDKKTSELPQITDILEKLFLKGLVVNLTLGVGSTKRLLKPTYEVAIPKEIQNVLPKNSLKLPQPKLQVMSTPPAQSVTHDIQIFIRNLLLIWTELQRRPAKRLKSGESSKRDLRRISESIGLDFVGTNESYIRYLWYYLDILDMLSYTDKQITVNDNKRNTHFWNSSLREQTQTIFQNYLKHATQKDYFYNLSYTINYYTGYRLDSTLPDYNKLFMALLNQLPEQTWISVEYFILLLNHGIPGGFLLPPDQAQKITKKAYYSFSYTKKLEEIENELVFDILNHLNFMGLVSLGYAGTNTLTSICTTPLYYTLVHNRTSENEVQEGQIVLQPDFQILAMGPVPTKQLAAIERFSERESVTEGVTTYRITKDSIYPALQNGDSIGAIMAFMRQVTGLPVPQNVERTLEEWSDQHERIIVRRNVLILQIDDAEALTQLLEDKEIGKYLHSINERTAWIPMRYAKKVRLRLQILKHLPTHSNGPQADLKNSLTFEDGELRSPVPLPSLYITGTVSQFAQPKNVTTWILTPQSIGAASQKGLDILTIITQIKTLTGTQLPADWEKKLKVWGHHYGDAHLAQVMLLRFDSSEALDELQRKDYKLRNWLTPLPRTTDGLAIITHPDIDEVKEVLTSWGIKLKEIRWW